MTNDTINLIKDIPRSSSNLIDMLHVIQEHYNYLPKEVLIELSEYLNISLSQIYSTASFYNDFIFVKKGKYNISLCLGTVCYVKGSNEILNEIKRILNINEQETTSDGKFSLDTTRCLGCCSMAPVIKINDDVYGYVKLSDVKNILSKYN